VALAMLRRRAQEAPLAALRDYAARYPALPVWEAMLARAELEAGGQRARRGLDACARDGFAALMRTPDWLCGLALLAEPAAAVGTPDQVAQLSDGLAPYSDRIGVIDDASIAFGPVARPLGLLAAAAGRGDEAGAHFARAVELSARCHAPGWELASIVDWHRSDASVGAPDGLRARGLALARDLELPWIAAELSQTTMP